MHHESHRLAQIGIRGKNHYLGYYKNEVEAAKAYDAKAIYCRGKKAKTNFGPMTHNAKTSQFRGVTWARRQHMWVAQIGYKGKNIYLGYFKSEVEAAKAYDARARICHGTKAKTNFMPRPQRTF